MKHNKRTQAVIDWCDKHWGLKVTKCTPDNAHGRCIGSWKTGWMVSGIFPGETMQWRRYDTIKQIAKISGYKD